MENKLYKEDLLLEAYDSITKGEYEKANALVNLAAQLPKRKANDVINKQESYTPEFVDELMNEFYELDGAILFESNKGKVLNTSLFKRFLSKKSIVRNPVRKILEEKGFILSTTIYNPIIGKTVRAMIDTRF